MITRVLIENFKSWQKTGELRFSPLTVFFGPNSSGKTSILQWLLLLKQTAESSDNNQTLNMGDDRSLVDLGAPQDIFFKHTSVVDIKWEMDWQLQEILNVKNPSKFDEILFSTDKLIYKSALQLIKNGKKENVKIVLDRLSYGFHTDSSPNTFEIRSSSQEKGEYELITQAGDFKFKRVQGRAWPLPKPVKCYGFPDQVRNFFQNAAFLSDFELEFEKLFKRIFYLGPLREYPKRQYSWAGSQPGDMGKRGERVVDAILAARELGKYLKFGRGVPRRSLEEHIAFWLKQLGLVDSFSVRPVSENSKLFQVWVKRTESSPEVLITDVGFGVSQILPVIVMCFYVPEGSIIILEQPEIHLHPRVQAGLADVFIEAIKTRNIQIILESHSEHLLRRFQRRIAEEVTFEANDASFYFCKVVNGASKIEHLKVNEYGNIENWPDDFFGDDLNEIAAMNLAAIKRKKLKMNL